MPCLESPELRPSWRLLYPSQQKVTSWTCLGKKMLIYSVRSRNVYENKGNKDKMPDEKSDSLGRVRPFLQEITHLEGKFVLNCLVRARSVQMFTH